MNRHYLINTKGEAILLISIVGFKVPPEISLKFRTKECSWFAYYLFKYTRINLMAEDKFKWVKEYIRRRINGN